MGINHLLTKQGHWELLVELGDSTESKFDSIRQNFDRFDSLLLHHSGLRPFMNCGLSALSNVLAKLLTVITIGLAVNAQ